MPTPRPASSKPKSVRLYQVARELNVALDTIVEALRERDFSLDDKLAAADPNARLEPEMYATLVETYSDDAEAKARVRELRAQIAAEDNAAEIAAREAAEREVAEREAAERAAAEAAAREAAAQEAQSADESPAAAETADGPASAEPTPAEASAEPAAEEGPEADASGVVRADRHRLSGTTVLGKIDLSGIGGGRTKRKRKSDEPAAGSIAERVDKKSGTPSDAVALPIDAMPAAGEGRRGAARKGKKGRREAPDAAEVESNVQETLQQTRQSAGRTRQKRRRERRDERAAQREQREQDLIEQSGTLRVMEFISTGDLAEAMNVPVTDVISKGFGMGMMVSINQRLDADAITLFAAEFGYDVEFMTDVEDDIELEGDDDPALLESRPPIVTIMGHVDHGKTSLLDFIREANVVAGEAGGITQHIGAYQVALPSGREVTFLDTPGHEAFTAMRARGAQVTDLVILVVAADDKVMPQTIEAINHARAAEVPIVVAINKVDRAEASPDRIMAQLADQGVQVEQYGGKTQCELISAKFGTNVDSLLEKVLLEADLMELQANPERNAIATVVEARLDKGRGVVATVLVENGTLREGDAYVVGLTSGRVRAMFNERDQRVKEAPPATPVQIVGLADAPDVGDRLVVLDDEREAREIASNRVSLIREQRLHQRRRISLDDISRRMAEGKITNLNLVVKADVGGSVEALSDALLKLSNDEVAVAIVHSGVGAITESDVMLAAASDAIIVGFQVRPNTGVRALAEREEIDIRLYSVIYDAIEEVRDALEGLLSPEKKETTTATLDVRDTFRVPKAGTIAGCYVMEGKISRNDRVRLVRDGVVVYDGQIDSLRRFKEDAATVAAGYECGLSIRNFNDVKVGDQIESYVVTEEKRTLTV